MKNLYMNDLGKAIYCDCYIPEYGRNKILGSITAEGLVEILRGHKNKTVLEVTNFIIGCPVCGFSQVFNLKYAKN
jgi:hypothetical protein